MNDKASVTSGRFGDIVAKNTINIDLSIGLKNQN